jgi:hypothetical protein
MGADYAPTPIHFTAQRINAVVLLVVRETSAW